MSISEKFSKAVGAVANKASEVSKTAADKAKQVAEIAKLNVKITAEEDKIRKAQQELGKLYYNDFEAGLPTDTEGYLAICNEIKAAKEQIVQYRVELEAVKAPAEETEEPAADVVEEAPVEEAPAEEAPVVPTEIEFTVVDDTPKPEDPEIEE